MEAEANENMGMSPEEISEFDHMTDEELITEIKDHCNSTALDYLINKYRNFVRAKARSYFLIGADREDIIQEGMIGFYKAVRDFRNGRSAPLPSSASRARSSRPSRRRRGRSTSR